MSALETLNVGMYGSPFQVIYKLNELPIGKPFMVAKNNDLTSMIAVLRYYAGWADKIHGKVIEVRY